MHHTSKKELRQLQIYNKLAALLQQLVQKGYKIIPYVSIGILKSYYELDKTLDADWLVTAAKLMIFLPVT